MIQATVAAPGARCSLRRVRPGSIEGSFNDSGYLLHASRQYLKHGGEGGIVGICFRSDEGAGITAAILARLIESITELNGRIEGGYQAARGEFFLLLVPSLDAYGAEDFRQDQETIRRWLGGQFRQKEVSPSSTDLRVTGVHLCNRDGEKADNVLFRAFRELFSASAPSAADETADRREIENIIVQELITPVFQPIVALKQGSVHGFEALSRLPQPSRIPNPEYLFKRAADFGLTSQVEMLCRRKAIGAARDLQLGGRLFLNVCPSIFLSSDHRQGATAAMLDEIGLSRSDITFELTERTLIEDYELFKRILSYYRQQGYSIAIDDLGSGYAGLKMLSELEPEYVKLSSFLIRDIDRTWTKQALVESLLAFCSRVGAKVIAEGIETAEELEYLNQAGVELGQGYYLARPSANPFSQESGFTKR